MLPKHIRHLDFQDREQMAIAWRVAIVEHQLGAWGESAPAYCSKEFDALNVVEECVASLPAFVVCGDSAYPIVLGVLPRKFEAKLGDVDPFEGRGTDLAKSGVGGEDVLGNTQYCGGVEEGVEGHLPDFHRSVRTSSADPPPEHQVVAGVAENLPI